MSLLNKKNAEFLDKILAKRFQQKIHTSEVYFRSAKATSHSKIHQVPSPATQRSNRKSGKHPDFCWPCHFHLQLCNLAKSPNVSGFSLYPRKTRRAEKLILPPLSKPDSLLIYKPKERPYLWSVPQLRAPHKTGRLRRGHTEWDE